MTSPSPSPKSKVKQKMERGIWPGLSQKSYGPPPPPHPKLLRMEEVSNNKTQRVKVTQRTLYQRNVLRAFVIVSSPP